MTIDEAIVIAEGIYIDSTNEAYPYTEEFGHALSMILEELKLLETFKELYDAYNLIGTIEEFKTLKMNKTVLPIATISINKEDLQRMVDEKVAQIELDIQAIRAKAIDDVLEILKKYDVPFNADANYEILELKVGDK